ncbi:hypothetical protein HN51_040959 [Arachis hypogaea]|nr:DNA polymerase epsilon catalytic subunit A [Arachis hypogaea]
MPPHLSSRCSCYVSKHNFDKSTSATSIVSDEVCTACDFNRPGKTCLRKLEWVWRGETFMAKKSDYYHIKKQIESDFVDGANVRLSKPFLDLPKAEQQSRLKDRLKKYCQKAYKRVLDKPVTELREAGICMRENPFYVDTVRRHYGYWMAVFLI